MTDYIYSKVAVYAELAGALRLARNSRSFVTDPVTGVPVNVTQGAFTAPYLDTDSSGIADFTATTLGPIRLTTGATFVDVFSEELPGLALAAPAAAQASADAAAASAASAAASASLVGAPADTAVATLVGNPASATRVSLSSTYLPQVPVAGISLTPMATPSVGGGLGFRLDKASAGDTHFHGLMFSVAGVDKWAAPALDYQNDDIVLAYQPRTTLQGNTTSGDVLRIAKDGETILGPGIGTPFGQGAGLRIITDQAVGLRVTHQTGADSPIALQLDSNGAVDAISITQYGAANSRASIDFGGGNPINQFRLAADPAGNNTKKFTIYDKLLSTDRLAVGLWAGVAGADTVLIPAASSGKVPLTLLALTGQTANILAVYDGAGTPGLLAKIGPTGNLGVSVIEAPTSTGPYIELFSTLMRFRVRGSTSFSFGAPGLGSGTPVGVIGIADATTVPAGTPTNGGVLFSETGALKWRGSSGTVTTLAVA